MGGSLFMVFMWLLCEFLLSRDCAVLLFGHTTPKSKLRSVTGCKSITLLLLSYYTLLKITQELKRNYFKKSGSKTGFVAVVVEYSTWPSQNVFCLLCASAFLMTNDLLPVFLLPKWLDRSTI
jgi:hypothetical protein